MSETFDIQKKYVRVMATHNNGLIEFEFSIGDPQVSVELIMPINAFHEFCARHEACILQSGEPPPDRRKPVADDEWHWNLHQATHERFRSDMTNPIPEPASRKS